MIKAPFNFIPASSRVFYPDWADKISMDIPFRNSVSGCIEVKLVAETPIFVRNGHKKDCADCSFSHTPDGKYFIPGTTVKGAVKNVMKILSSGQMQLQPNTRFAQRYWNKKYYPLLKPEVQKSIKAGWLLIDNDGSFAIRECSFGRINHRRLDEWLESMGREKQMAKAFEKTDMIKLDDNKKTIVFKYGLFDGLSLDDLSFCVDEEYSTSVSRSGIGHERLEVCQNGPIKGSIVLTGQPDKWENVSAESRVNANGKGMGKFYEFVFIDKEIDKVYPISKDMFKEYESIYRDSNDWAFLKGKMLKENSKGMPVFFRAEGDKVADFGIANLYKLPYKYSANEIESRRCGGDYGKPDLSDCIFGYVNTAKNQSLKGRVRFTPFFCEEPASVLPKVVLTLNSPKATYYPLYVDGGVNYNSDSAKLAGYKRYILRKGTWNKQTSDSLDSEFMPLSEGSTFKGAVYFHNLKKEELGALLSSLTFHGTKACRHQIGQGKPYGYGKTRLELLSAKDNTGADLDVEALMGRFEGMMTSFCLFRDSPSVKELLSLSDVSKAVDANNADYQYMRLSLDPEVNEFANARDNEESLQRFSRKNGCSTIGLDYSIVGREMEKLKIERECCTKEVRAKLDKFEADMKELVERVLKETSIQIPTESEQARLIKICDDGILSLESLQFMNWSDVDKYLPGQQDDLKLTFDSQRTLYRSQMVAKRADISAVTFSTCENIGSGIQTKSSLGALFGFLKKNKNNISADDYALVEKRLDDIWRGMSPKDRKDYSKSFPSKKWQDLIDAMGQDFASKIYAQIMS